MEPLVPIPRPTHGFPPGITPITRAGDTDSALQMDFAILVLELGGAHATYAEQSAQEACWVLLDGCAVLETDAGSHAVERASLFDGLPALLHVSGGTAVRITARSARCELAVARTANDAKFAPGFVPPARTQREDRGAGLAQGACRREVRLMLDRTTRPHSNLVVGEVVTPAGRWSSYPPHHHPQPELYHYRFSLAQGYGHAELGERVFKVRDGDTLRIAAGQTHAQVAAPGYAMWYLWIVRHLEGRPYAGFTYQPEHTWLLDASQQGWISRWPAPPADRSASHGERSS